MEEEQCLHFRATLKELLSLLTSQAHIPGSSDLGDCGPAPGISKAYKYEQLVSLALSVTLELVMEPSGSPKWAGDKSANNRPLTPCLHVVPADFPNSP